MGKENLNENLAKIFARVNRALTEVMETIGEAVEDNPVVKKQSWEDLAARGQRIAEKWTDAKGDKQGGSGAFDSIKSTLESQFESMPRIARERTAKTLSQLAGVVDDLTSLGKYRSAAPDPGATLNGHGLRPIYGPMAIRRAAGTSKATESSIGSLRRAARQWRNEDI